MGHHPVYFMSFAISLAKNGVNVIPFCISPEHFLTLIESANLSPSVRSRILEPQLIAPPSSSQFRPARYRAHYQAIRFFRRLGRQLRSWESINNTKLSLVFFSCIYDHDFQFFSLAEKFFGFPWSGLYLHVRSFRMPGSLIPYTNTLPCPEKFLASSSMVSICVLDEGAVEPISKINNGKPVIVIPDFSIPVDSSDDSFWGLARKVLTFANGRPIVSLTGHLQWTKGLELFTSVASHPDLQHAFFFLGGDINWQEIPVETSEYLRLQWESLPNLFGHFQRISSEESINNIISISSVVFAVYQSFPNSSNILTKSALHQRPVIVSDRYLMAARVREFYLGEVVSETCVNSTVQTLTRMLEPSYYPNLSLSARWSEYKMIHSIDRLDSAISSLAQSIGGCSSFA